LIGFYFDSILFNFIPLLASDKLKLFDCSLSQNFSDYLILIFNIFYYLFFSSIFSGHQFLFSKRKILAQSFKTHPFSK